jgi:hypothetical protein
MATLEDVPVKINNASLSDLKATSDDAIAPVSPHSYNFLTIST